MDEITIFTERLVPPCGLDCAVCMGRLRYKRQCPGCHDLQPGAPKSCLHCVIRNCTVRTGEYCDCPDLPCEKLRHLDKRYRTKYGVSPIANLEFIRERGIEVFLARERGVWLNEEGIRCMHDQKVYPLP